MNLNNSFYNINLAGFSHTNDANNYFDDLNINYIIKKIIILIYIIQDFINS